MDLIQALTNTPLALEATWAQRYFSQLLNNQGGKLSDSQGLIAVGEKAKIKAVIGGQYQESQGQYYRVVDGIAVIPVVGPLHHRWSWYNWGYQELAEKMLAAKEDPTVHGILLDCETPGGTVAGLPDFCGLIKSIDKHKPVYALINDQAASAGMAIASQCRKRFITKNGKAGSIGCVMVHVDQSKQMDRMGVNATLIYSGGHKVDGNPYQSLPESVATAYQAECDQHRLEFAELVASNIDLSVDQLLATEAKMYRGQAAIDLGLADELVNAYEIIPTLNGAMASLSTSSAGINMSQNTTTPEASTSQQDTSAQTDNQTPQANTEASTTGPQESAPQAVDQKARIAAILNSDAAKANASLASHLAFNSDCTPAEAEATLKASAPTQQVSESEHQTDSGFEAAMDKNNPEIGAEHTDGTDTELTAEQEADAMLAIYNGTHKVK